MRPARTLPAPSLAPRLRVKLGRAGKEGCLRGCHGQAKRRQALRVGRHASAFGLGMAPISCACASQKCPRCAIVLTQKSAAGDPA